jgi:hypothetical protein
MPLIGLVVVGATRMCGLAVSRHITGLTGYDEEVVKPTLFIHRYASFLLRESRSHDKSF